MASANAEGRTARPVQAARGGVQADSLHLTPRDLIEGAAVGVAETDAGLSATGAVGAALSRIITAPLPFHAVAAQWTGGKEFSVELRTSVDGASWSEWQTVEVESSRGDASGHSISSTLVFTPDGALHAYVQCRIVLPGSDGPARRALHGFRLVFLADGGAPRSEVPFPFRTGLEPSLAEVMAADKPPVVSRTAWGCPDGQQSPGWGYEYYPDYDRRTVSHIIIHHTATTNGPTDWAAQVRIIWHYHTYEVNGDGTGWGDVGYNFLIDANGTIYEGRAGGDDVVGAHTGMFNFGSMGIGIMGTYNSVAPASAALRAAERLMAWKCQQKNISPTGTASMKATRAGWGCADTWITARCIASHRDYAGNACTSYDPNATSCPGNSLHALLPTLRSNVAALVQQGQAVYAAELSGVSISPTFVQVGTNLRITVTVRNTGNVTLRDLDPNPTRVYNEGERAPSEHYDSIKLGVDYEGHGSSYPYPYRWGLGGDLAPGQARTITREVNIKYESGPKLYWVGLVREGAGVLVDHQGLTSVQARLKRIPAHLSVGIANVSIRPGTTFTGSVIEVSAEVENWTNQTLPTQERAPGYIYTEGEVCPSDVYGAYRIGVDYDGRTGKDYPYRWGVGTVPPYSVRVIRGFIRFPANRSARNFWVGFVQEGVQWLQPGLAATSVRVVTPASRLRLPVVRR